MKQQLFIFLLLFLSSLNWVFSAVPEEESIEPLLPPICSTVYEIVWPDQVKVGSTHEYQVVPLGTGSMDPESSIIYTLRRDKKVVEVVSDRDKYLRYFTIPGDVTLEAKVNSSLSCEGIIKKDIRVYKWAIVYIGIERPGIDTETLENQGILYKNYVVSSNLSQSADASTVWESIEQSDIIVVGSNDILSFFSDIVKFQKTRELNFLKKQIYIVSDYSRSFLSKVIAFPLSQIGATKVVLISDDQFYGLLSKVPTMGTSTLDIGEELSYEKTKTVYSLSGLLGYLAYAGFSYQLLAFLLSITFVVLILNFLKQIVGLNVFGIYYPVLFAITISLLGISAFVFIAIGFFSILLVNAFSKKIHLLLHAKRSLLISLYILLFLFILGMDNIFELSLIRYTVFDNPFIIFPLFITIILADKIFQEDINIFSKSGLSDILQYAVVTGIVYFIIEYTTLQYFLISYPDSIILIVFLNIIVGRYMGLQVVEYFRFLPLLKKLNEEE